MGMIRRSALNLSHRTAPSVRSDCNSWILYKLMKEWSLDNNTFGDGSEA
jgi:hypothetical protein